MPIRRVEATVQTILDCTSQFYDFLANKPACECLSLNNGAIFRLNTKWGLEPEIKVTQEGSAVYVDYLQKFGKYADVTYKIIMVAVVLGAIALTTQGIRLLFLLFIGGTSGVEQELLWNFLPFFKAWAVVPAGIVFFILRRLHSDYVERSYWKIFDEKKIETQLVDGTFAPESYNQSHKAVTQILLISIITLFFFILNFHPAIYLLIGVVLFSDVTYLFFSKNAEVYRRVNLTRLSRLVGLDEGTGFIFNVIMLLIISCGISYFADTIAFQLYCGPLMTVESLVKIFEIPSRQGSLIETYLPQISADPSFWGIQESISERGLANHVLGYINTLAQNVGLDHKVKVLWLFVTCFYLVMLCQIPIKLILKLRSNYKKGRRLYSGSKLLAKETLKQIDSRPTETKWKLLFPVWSLISWTMQNAVISAVMIMYLAVLGDIWGFKLPATLDWIMIPFDFLKNMAIFTFGQSGLIYYKLAIFLITTPLSVFFLLLFSCSIVRLIEHLKILVSKKSQPDAKMQKRWREFLSFHDLPGNIILRLSAKKDPGNFWFLWFPVVELPHSGHIVSEKEHLNFPILHEIGHLAQWRSRVIWEVLARTSFSGEGFLEPCNDQWEIELEPDRFALSKMKKEESKVEALNLINKNLGDFGARKNIKESTKGNRRKKDKWQPLSSLKKIYKFYFLNDLLGYFHPPEEYREKRLLQVMAKNDVLKSPDRFKLEKIFSWKRRCIALSGTYTIAFLIGFSTFAGVYKVLAGNPKSSSNLVSFDVWTKWQWTAQSMDANTIGAINTIIQNSDTLIIGASKGLFRLNTSDRTFEIAIEVDSTKIMADGVYCLAVSGDALMAGSPDKVMVFNRSVSKTIRFLPKSLSSGSHEKPYIYQITPLDSVSFIANTALGIVHVAPKMRNWLLVENDSRWSPYESPYHNQESGVWLNGDLVRFFDSHQKRFGETSRNQMLGSTQPLDIDSGNELKVDNNYMLWKIESVSDAHSKVISPYDWVPPIAVNFEYPNIFAVMVNEAKKQAALILGEDENKIYIFFDNDRTTVKTIQEILPFNSITSYSISSDMSLLIGTWNGEIWRFKADQWERIL